jgi:hypothetical protein
MGGGWRGCKKGSTRSDKLLIAGNLESANTMKAMTIKQPWVHAILHEGKDVENRT